MTSTVTYTYPVAGTVAPTTAQMLNANIVIAKVNMADADTTATITTNFGNSQPLPPPATTDVASLFPLISVYQLNSGTAYPLITFALTDSNTVTMTKSTAAGGGGTVVVQLMRPNTLIR